MKKYWHVSYVMQNTDGFTIYCNAIISEHPYLFAKAERENCDEMSLTLINWHQLSEEDILAAIESGMEEFRGQELECNQ